MERKRFFKNVSFWLISILLLNITLVMALEHYSGISETPNQTIQVLEENLTPVSEIILYSEDFQSVNTINDVKNIDQTNIANAVYSVISKNDNKYLKMAKGSSNVSPSFDLMFDHPVKIRDGALDSSTLLVESGKNAHLTASFKVRAIAPTANNRKALISLGGLNGQSEVREAPILYHSVIDGTAKYTYGKPGETPLIILDNVGTDWVDIKIEVSITDKHGYYYSGDTNVNIYVNNELSSVQNVQLSNGSLLSLDRIRIKEVSFYGNNLSDTSQGFSIDDISVKLSVNKDELLETLTKAETLYSAANANSGSEGGQYPSQAVGELQTAINNAQTILYATDKTQKDVNTACSLLRTAISNCVPNDRHNQDITLYYENFENATDVNSVKNAAIVDPLGNYDVVKTYENNYLKVSKSWNQTSGASGIDLFFDGGKAIKIANYPALPENVPELIIPGKSAVLSVQFDVMTATSPTENRSAAIGLDGGGSYVDRRHIALMYYYGTRDSNQYTYGKLPEAPGENESESKYIFGPTQNGKWHNIKMELTLTDDDGNLLQFGDGVTDAKLNIYVDGVLTGIQNESIMDTASSVIDRFVIQEATFFNNEGICVDNIRVSLKGESPYTAVISATPTPTPLPDGTILFSEDFSNDSKYSAVNTANQVQLTDAGFVIQNTNGNYGIVEDGTNKYLKLSALPSKEKAQIEIPLSNPIRVNGKKTDGSTATGGPNEHLIITYDINIKGDASKNRTSSLMLLAQKELIEKDNHDRPIAELRYAYSNATKNYPLTYVPKNQNVISALDKNQWYSVKVDLKLTDQNGNYISKADVYLNQEKVLENQPIVSTAIDSVNVSMTDRLAISTNIIGNTIDSTDAGIGIDNITVTYNHE